MPGIITFKPIQANLTHNTSHLLGMDPYCSITLGNNQVVGEICHKGGVSPHWSDALTLPASQESKCLLELKDKSLLHDSNIGTCEVDLKEITSQGRILKWYKLDYKDQPAGEILIEASFQPENPSHIIHSSIEKQAGMGLAGLISSTNEEKSDQKRIEDPSELIGVEEARKEQEKISKTLGQGPFSQPISESFNKGHEPPSVRHAESLQGIGKRSNDLNVPTNREAETRPNYENEPWGKTEERIKDIFIHKPQESLERSLSEQPMPYHEPKQHHLNDKDYYHCQHKELEGLDLTSDLGPHSTGYDKNLWILPENLKEMQFKSTPPK